MNIREIAHILRDYEKAASMLEPVRFGCSTGCVAQAPAVFGMNFELMRLSREEQQKAFASQIAQREALYALMKKQPVDNGQMQALFGFSADELREYMDSIFPIIKPIPDKLVVLGFDDAFLDQYENALPVLKKYGFGATFFIAGGERFGDKSLYMTWEQIKELGDMGYELANHSLNHPFGAEKLSPGEYRHEITGMEDEMLSHGIKKPVTFAYPGGTCTQMTHDSLRDCGYSWGRGNNGDGICGMTGMAYYDPLMDSPLAIPNYGDPDFYSVEILESKLEQAQNGRIIGFTYHVVGNKERWPGTASFERQMEILHSAGCTVIPMSGLSEYIDPAKALAYTC